MTDPVNATMAATPPRVTPTVSQPTRINWGAWFAQGLAHETHIIEAVAEGGVAMALSAIPFGSIVARFIGPTLIAQYVDMGLAALEGVLAPMSISVAGGTVLATVANLINTNEAAFASFVGDQLEPMLKAELAKRGMAF